jgi:hypothetical protein
MIEQMRRINIAYLGVLMQGDEIRALQAWLGHKNIQHTVRYIELAPDRFKTSGANRAEEAEVKKSRAIASS